MSMKHTYTFWILFACFFAQTLYVNAATQKPDANGILYVKTGGTGAADGSSWANAYPNVADPLLLTAQQYSGYLTSLGGVNPTDTIREIWVAEGTYYPLYSASGYHFTNKNFPSTATTTNRDNAFVLVKDVKLYGGFPPDANDATHNTLATRDWDANPAILSGNIGTTSVNTDNCYHVVISAGEVGTACIDGFTISGGYGNAGTTISVNGSTMSRFYGGGIYNINSSPALNHIIFSENVASYGGGIRNANSSPILTHVIISGNVATGTSNGGGGIANTSSSPRLTYVTISGNSANNNGGGIYNNNSSSPILTNVTIIGNSANSNGGGIYNNNSSSPILTNVTISGNSANNGGGIYNTASSPILTNITISGNLAINSGGGIYNLDSSPKIRNSIIYGNTATTGSNAHNTSTSSNPSYSSSLIEGSGGSGSWISSFGIDDWYNIDANPNFVAPVAATSAPTTTGDYRLQPTSPCINNGDTWFFDVGETPDLSAITTDLDGNPRFVAGKIDMGAYQRVVLPDFCGGDGTQGNPYQICTAEQLDAVRYFLDKHYKLAADITLSGDWEPIGNDYGFFTSTFDGNGHTISGLHITEAVYVGLDDFHNYWSAYAAGLFAVLDRAEISNLTLNNPMIDIGYGGYEHYALGTVAGKSYGAQIRNVIIHNPTIQKDIGSWETNFFGGVVGYALEGALPNSTGMKMNIINGIEIYGGKIAFPNVISTCSMNYLGGIAGANYKSVIVNAAVYGTEIGTEYTGTVPMDQLSVGGIVGYTSAVSPADEQVCVLNSISTAKVKIPSTLQVGGYFDVGGICGWVNEDAVVNTIYIGNWNDLFGYEDAGVYTISHNHIFDDVPAAYTVNIVRTLNDKTPGVGGFWAAAKVIDDDTPYGFEGSMAKLNGWIYKEILGIANTPYMGILPLKPTSNGIFYVKEDGIGDGSSWANAYPNVADPLLLAAQQYSGYFTSLGGINPADTIREIWVAEGTYYPMYSASGYHFTNKNFPSTATTTNRDNAFVLVKDVKLYGGFPPDANDVAHNTLAARDWNANPAILSGDIGTTSVNTDNCYHVMISAEAVGTACIDGFTISGGYANGTSSTSVNGRNVIRNEGGGMNNQSTSPVLTNVTISENVAIIGGGILNSNSSPTLTHVTLIGNLAYTSNGGGGGIYNSNSSPILTHVSIIGNSTNNHGGGMANSSSSPRLTDVILSENSATYNGGGIFNQNSSSPILNNVTLRENSADNNGGGIYSNTSSSITLTNVTLIGNSATSNGGGIYNNNSPSSQLTNVILSGNLANNGGGIYNNSSSPILTNLTISGNSANTSGGGIYNTNTSSPPIRNSIIYGNSATTDFNIMNNDAGSIPAYFFSLIEGSGGSSSWNAAFGTDNWNNIDVDPKFVAPVAASLAPTTTGDYHLQSGTPCALKGTPWFFNSGETPDLSAITTDLDGNPRFFQNRIDMGPYQKEILPDFCGGNGTQGNPYLICTAEQLDFVRYFLDKHFVLNNDITLTGNWLPIGDEYGYFTGTLDGAEHTISGLHVTEAIYVGLDDYYYSWPAYAAGLFAVLDGAEVSNLTLNNPVIDIDVAGSYSWAGHFAIGTVAGKSYGAQIREVIINNPTVVKYIDDWETNFFGGVVGYALEGAQPNSTGMKMNIINGVEIYGGKVEFTDVIDDSSYNFLGGIAGANSKSVIVNAAVYGTEIGTEYTGTTTMDQLSVGGIVGYTSAVNPVEEQACILNSISTAKIKIPSTLHVYGNFDVGGICGFVNEDAVVNTIYIGNWDEMFGQEDAGAYTISNNHIYDDVPAAYAVDIVTTLNDKTPTTGGFWAAAKVISDDTPYGFAGSMAKLKGWIYKEILGIANTPAFGVIPPSLDLINILATHGDNGSINPEGEVQVPYGGSQKFTFTPNTGYHVDSVIVNGAPISPAGGGGEWNYTFTNLKKDATIHVTFAKNSYTITATATPANRGIIEPSGVTTVLYGDELTVSFSPKTPYVIDQVLIDGVNDPDALLALTYTFTNIDDNHTIEVTFMCPPICPDLINIFDYHVVEVAGICWTKENLRARLYQSEEEIPFAKPYEHIKYPDVTLNEDNFGLLYDWYSAVGEMRGADKPICPEGWRLPTSAELLLLNMHPADALRNPTYWLSPNSSTNLTGFDSRGAGTYNSALDRFEELYGYTAYWSSDAPTAQATCNAGCLTYYCNKVEIRKIKLTDGASVRCVISE